jgi:putative oxidoreductase
MHLTYVTTSKTMALAGAFLEEAATMSASMALKYRHTTIGRWSLRILTAAIFLVAGLMKLFGRPIMVQEFDAVGFGQWFRYLTGLLEIIGALAVLAPYYSAFGAAMLLVVDIGAFIAQIAVLHMDWIHTIAIGALLATVIYLQRDQIIRFA